MKLPAVLTAHAALAALALTPAPAEQPQAGAHPAMADDSQAFIKAQEALLFGRLVHHVDELSEAEGGHFELYVHAATIAPAYEIRFRLRDAGEAAALREVLRQHRRAHRGSFYVLLAYEPASLHPGVPMAELRNVRAAQLLPLPGGTDELQSLLDRHPGLDARLPRHPEMQDSWDWD